MYPPLGCLKFSGFTVLPPSTWTSGGKSYFLERLNFITTHLPLLMTNRLSIVNWQNDSTSCWRTYSSGLIIIIFLSLKRNWRGLSGGSIIRDFFRLTDAAPWPRLWHQPRAPKKYHCNNPAPLAEAGASKYILNTVNHKPEELGSWNFERMFIPHFLSCVTCHVLHVTSHM